VKDMKNIIPQSTKRHAEQREDFASLTPATENADSFVAFWRYLLKTTKGKE